MGNNNASLSPLLATYRRHLSAQRNARRARRALEHEISHYNTPAERLELGAILDRHPSHETAELRDIVDSQAATA